MPKRANKYPPEDPNYDWVTSQAPRHAAARDFYGGTRLDAKTGVSADQLLNPLYTSQTATEAVDYAVQACAAGAASRPSSQQIQGDGAEGQQQEDWLEKESKGITHMQANLLQVRMAGQLITRFQPFRHTVIIAGRPMQASCPEPKLEPPAMRCDHMLSELLAQSFFAWI